MKPIPWLTTQVVILILGVVAMGLAVLVGVPAWLVATNRAPSSLLVVPFGTILGAISTAAVGWGTYIKGKYQIPPYFSDPSVQQAVRTIAPPPLDLADIEPEGTTLAPVEAPHDRPRGGAL